MHLASRKVYLGEGCSFNYECFVLRSVLRGDARLWLEIKEKEIKWFDNSERLFLEYIVWSRLE